jgi:hypothetical protein
LGPYTWAKHHTGGNIWEERLFTSWKTTNRERKSEGKRQKKREEREGGRED